MKYSFDKFTNISERDFVTPFDREPYEIKAGASEYFPPFLVRHLTKRLADREMILKHGKTMKNTPERKAFELRCMHKLDAKAQEELDNFSTRDDIAKQRDELIKQGKINVVPEEKPEEEKPKRKPGRPKKDTVEFEGSPDAAANKIKAKIG